jgi:quercetin dioxygenase-like cupin family protein
MFQKQNGDGYRSPLPGIRQKTLVYGARTLMTEFILTKGHTLPRHTHPYEQTGYLVSGRLRLAIGEGGQEVGPGDAWSIPEGVEHGAEIIEDSVAIEVFSPPRKDYLP